MIRFKKLGDNILLVTATRPAELGRMFVRPQEFYESPSARFRRRYFELAAFKKYYGKRFTYYRDYRAYNIPGEVFLDWQTVFAGRETEDEQALLALLGPLPARFYLIGVLAHDENSRGHEITHALFHLDAGYRESVERWLEPRGLTLEEARELAKARRALRELQYHESVMVAELNAYVLHESGWLKSRGVSVKALTNLRGRLEWMRIQAFARAQL